MSVWDKTERIFKTVLPAPFTIAAVLTAVTFCIAWLFAPRAEDSAEEHFFNIISYWEQGLWNRDLMVFALQMMLILVLGHALALSKPIDRFISKFLFLCTSTSKAAAVVAFFTIIVGLFNWGLALIFGAVFARKTAEYAQQRGFKLNYPVIGAAGYSGLMVWHGGISGSSLTKVAEPGHLHSLVSNRLTDEQLEAVPDFITFETTVFGQMNITASILVVLLIPVLLYWIGSRSKSQKIKLPPVQKKSKPGKLTGAEKLDHTKIAGIAAGIIVLGTAVYKATLLNSLYAYFTPDNINLLLLGLGLLFHGSFYNFIKAVESAVGGAAGILIQFPLYFGIMGIMSESGMVAEVSTYIAEHAGPILYPVFTFASAGLVNIFVPSGGGQWAIQGPIIIKTALETGIPFEKGIMALAYGDQITNMLQPFWALPLLGVTGLKAKEILPYTLLMMIAAGMIYLGVLLIF